MVNIYGLSLEKIEEFLISIGEKKFRAKQIWEWLYIHNVTSFDEMTNLSKSLIETLKEKLSFNFIKIKRNLMYMVSEQVKLHARW